MNWFERLALKIAVNRVIRRYPMLRSWKTSSLGILGVIPVILSAIKTLMDGDPATNPDWTVVISAILMAFGLTQAKDHDVVGGPGGL